jgi:hypothetical protein
MAEPFTTLTVPTAVYPDPESKVMLYKAARAWTATTIAVVIIAKCNILIFFFLFLTIDPCGKELLA